MIHFLRCENLFLRFNSIQALRIQPVPNPFQKCYCGKSPPASLIEFLQNSLGFSPERALTLSQQFNRSNPKNPDAVITFFKSQGFSDTHIKSIINRAPLLLGYLPECRLMAKIRFFKDKAISESDLVDLMVANPRLFTRSLERHIKPVLDVLRSILATDEIAVQLLIRSKLVFDLHTFSTNLTILRNYGVQNHHISKLFMNQPRALMVKPDRFNQVVERVKVMGFKPQSRLFVQAVFIIAGMRRQTWVAKFKVYTSLGWSAEEVLSVFCKQPVCMSLSDKKIRKGFAYLTKELGWVPSYILIYPSLLSYSLEKRIIPRHRFLQFLAWKGLIKEYKIFASSFKISEKRFLKNFVTRYESEVPDILKIYEGLIRSKLLNIRDGEGCKV